MFKKLGLLLASIIAIPSMMAFASSFDQPSMVVAEESEESPYEYTEDTDTGYDYYIRYYKSCILIPEVQKRFCAPSGYTFALTYSDEQVDALLEEMERCHVDYDYKLMDCVFYYGIEGTSIYSGSDPEWPNGKEAARSFILNCVNSFVLFEIRELTVATDLFFTFEFQFCAENTNYHFVFENQNIHVEPYDELDFIHVSSVYYVRNDEHRFNIRADLIYGFFNEEPSNNIYGFETEETHTNYQGYKKANYEISFFAHDTIPIGTITEAGDGFEMYYSDNDLDIRARLTFVSGGVEYEYWSRPLMVGNPKLHTIVDGIYDRDFIQRGQDHTFTLDINRNVFNVDEGVAGSIGVRAVPVGLNDTEYGHVYSDMSEFPAVGQVGHYYYVLTDEEKATYNPSDTSFVTSGNLFYTWDAENEQYEYFWGKYVIDSEIDFDQYYDPETGGFTDDFNVDDYFNSVSSLPFNGAWEFYYAVYISGPGYEMRLYENYGQTIQVVSGNDTSKTINLNVPDHVNLYTDGGSIEIVPSIANLDDSYVCYFDHELSKDGVVEISQDDNGVLNVTPKSAGVVSLTITAESRLFDKITKTVEIHVVDAIYEVAKIDAPANYINAGDNVRFALNIRGLSSFQNLDVDWSVSDRNGMQIADDKVVDNKDASITIMDADIGDYTISASYNGVQLDKITRQVRYQSDKVDPTDDIILLNVPDTINLLSGADPLDIVPTVSSFNSDIDYYFDYEVSKENLISLNENSDGSLTVNPINSGTLSLTITANYEPNHKIAKTVNVRVLDAIYDVSSIQVPDEFHYAGKDLTAAVSIRGFTNIQNLKIDWEVLNKNGDPLPEDQIVDNGDATITILAPDSDDYTISAYYDGIKLDTITIKVRYVDMDKFLRINIWWIFLITISFVALLLFLKFLLNRSKTTVENIEKVYQVCCQCLSDDKLTKEELIKIRKEITKCMHRCEDLNIDALNQYEKATRYLRKSLFDCKALIKDYDTTTPADRGVYTDRLDKDLAKALNVAKEIENAKGLIESYHVNANRHNFESLDDGSKKGKNKK